MSGPTGVIDAGPLERAATAIPGACYFMLPGVRVDGRPAGSALFDTGSGRTHLTSRLADTLGLAVLSPRGATGVAGHARGTRRWIDTADLPGFSCAQIEVTAMDLPFTAQLGDGSLPEIVLGNELVATSPVLDLRRGRLLLRGSPVASLAGGGTVAVPLSRQRYADLDVLPVDVGGRRLQVALDTGMHVALRLTAHGLRRAGLPADAAAWRARGAVAMDVGGAGQRATAALLVRIDAIAIGPFVLERPWVLLLLDASVGDEDEGALGAGALMAFARVGIDRERRVLELEPGAAFARASGGVLRAPAPGVFLGMSVVVPDAAARARGERLPVVREVVAGSAAAAAGVVVGDRVVGVDGVACEGMAASVVNERLCGRGERGEVVVVEVRRVDGRVERVVVRAG